MKIHVGIVSEQTLANLIPILMERPEKVYLACSDAMASRGLGRRLKRRLAKKAIEVEIKPRAPDTGLKEIHEYAFSLAAEIERVHPGAEVALNATGGTKLMSLGFVEVFRGIARKIIYTDTSHGRIEVFPDGSGAVAQPIDMPDVLDVPEYLAAQGLRYRGARSDDASWHKRMASRKRAAKYLGRKITSPNVQKFVGMMNRCANLALEKIPGSNEERLAAPRQTLPNRPWGEWKNALAELARARLVDWRPGAKTITFSDVTAAQFLRGGWLEEYAWHSVNEQRPFDTRLGIEASWEGGRHVHNEFDVMATHGNQLLYIECKTLRLHEENDSHIAYKVDSLGRDARGLFGETWLLSARDPTPVLVERAAQSGIRLLGPDELARLQKIVRRWKKRA